MRTAWRIGVVTGLLLLVAGTAASGPATAAARFGRVPMEPAAPPHFGQPGLGPSNASQSSLNWAGYGVTGGTFSNVAGGWTQPAAVCSSKATQAAFWVGIDGLRPSDPTVQQIGTDSDCTKGRARRGGVPIYYAWYELFPQGVVVLPTSNHPVAPGDSISAGVVASGSVYSLIIADGNKWFFGTTLNASQPTQNSSAEWIAEAPSVCSGSRCKTTSLTDFGSIAFSGAAANHKVISAPGFTDYQITMVTKGSKLVRAQPSGLTFGGSVFGVAWHHA
jgi:Peptidase A4 family